MWKLANFSEKRVRKVKNFFGKNVWLVKTWNTLLVKIDAAYQWKGPFLFSLCLALKRAHLQVLRKFPLKLAGKAEDTSYPRTQSDAKKNPPTWAVPCQCLLTGVERERRFEIVDEDSLESEGRTAGPFCRHASCTDKSPTRPVGLVAGQVTRRKSRDETRSRQSRDQVSRWDKKCWAKKSKKLLKNESSNKIFFFISMTFAVLFLYLFFICGAAQNRERKVLFWLLLLGDFFQSTHVQLFEMWKAKNVHKMDVKRKNFSQNNCKENTLSQNGSEKEKLFL